MDSNLNPEQRRQLTVYDDTPTAGRRAIADLETTPRYEITPLTGDQKVVMVQGKFGLINVKYTRNAGSFGSIVTGQDPRTETTFAIKVILCQYNDRDYFELVHGRRARREAHILNQLRGHANIVNFFALEFGPMRHAMIKTEYLGQTLRKIVARHRFNEANLIRLARQLNSALIYMQARNIVHHDIKPANIMLRWYLNPNQDPREINRRLSLNTFKFIDYGLAKIYRQANPIERKYRSGTHKYKSPEKIMDDEYDANLSDQYSLGVCLYIARVGKPAVNAYHAVNTEMSTDEPNWRAIARETLPREHQQSGIKRIITGLLRVEVDEVDEDVVRFNAQDTEWHLSQLRRT